MKTAEDAAFDYANNVFVTLRDNGSTTFDLDEIFEFAKQDFLAGYQEAQRWRSVEEELPEMKNGFVLVKNENGFHAVSTDVKSNISYIKEMYTHWRPIND